MARYIYGWIERVNQNPQMNEPSWVAVKRLDDLLNNIKDYDGFNCLFGEEESLSHRLANESAFNFLKSYLGVMVADQKFPFPPLAPQRGLPENVSAQAQEEYDLFDVGYKTIPACDAITCTQIEWIGWREIKQTEWEKTTRRTDGFLPEYYRNDQGEVVFRFPAWRVARPPASWISWQELKQVDWEEEAVWIDQRVYVYRRNEQGELIPLPPSYSAWHDAQGRLGFRPDPHSPQEEFERRVGHRKLDFSKVQEWDFGDLIFRTEQKKMKRKEAITNWESVFKVLEELAETYGDEGVRIVAWLDW